MLRFAIALLISVLLTAPAVATAHPFYHFAGKWAGDGKFWFGKGRKERVRCEVEFRQDGPKGIMVEIACALTSTKVKVNCGLTATDGNITGICQSPSHGVTRGVFAGSINDDGKSIEGGVTTVLGLALVALTQKQNRHQEVTLGIGRVNLEANLSRKD